MKIILKKEDIDKICTMYKTGQYYLKDLSELFGYSIYIIRKILIENNIKIIAKTRHCNMKINQNFFDNIDTEAKAYFLGFLIADGNIFQTKQGLYNLSLEINKRDEKILWELKELLNADSKISYRTRLTGDFAKICIGSNHLCNSLMKYGVIPQKTKKLLQLPKIKSDLEKHFLRGLIDGDGSIYFHIDKKSLKKYWHVTFCSYNYSICQDFEERCNKLLNISQNPAKILSDKNSHIYRVHYNQKFLVIKLLKILYENCNYKLDRKYNLFVEIIKNEEDIV